MKKIFFVRHAQPNYENHNDMLRELTEKGMADRALVTEFLSDKGITAVYSSPYKRAVDTVKPFAESRGLKITTIDDLRERKVGEGWIEDFDTYSRRQWDDRDYKLPEGESLNEVQRRNIAVINELLSRTPDGENIAVGTHGTALSTIINYYRPSFGYDDFLRLGKLPWIVEMTFEDGKCVEIVSHDVFTGEKCEMSI